MKTKHLFLAVVFLFVLHFAKSTSAQAVVDNDFELVFIDGDGIEHKAIRARKTISANGSITITGSFKLEKSHPLVPPTGWWPKIIEVRISTAGADGGSVVISDEKVDIPQNGRFNVSLHLNGSGNHLPWGWYTPDDD